MTALGGGDVAGSAMCYSAILKFRVLLLSSLMVDALLLVRWMGFSGFLFCPLLPFFSSFFSFVPGWYVNGSCVASV